MHEPEHTPARSFRANLVFDVDSQQRSHGIHPWAACLSLVVISSGNLPQVVSAQDKKLQPLTIEDISAARHFAFRSQVSLSPDGRWVTYVITNPQRIVQEHRPREHYTASGAPWYALGAELWLTNTTSGESTNLSSDHGVSWGGVWSRDGSALAFLSDRAGRPQVWMWEIATQEARVVSPAVIHASPWFGWQPLQWMPDNQSVLVQLLSASSPEGPRREILRRQQGHVADSDGVQVFEAAGSLPSTREPANPALSLETVGDLALLSVRTGHIQRLVSNSPTAWYALSPDGVHIAVMLARGTSKASSQDMLFDLGVVDVSLGNVRILVRSIIQDGGVAISWSPDGATLAYTVYSSSNRLWNGEATATSASNCYAVSVRGGEPRNLTPGFHPPLGDWYQGPLWDDRGRFVYLVGGDTLWRTSLLKPQLEAVATVPERGIRGIVALSDQQRVFGADGGRSIIVRTRDPRTLRLGFASIDLRTRRSTVLLEEDVGESLNTADYYRSLNASARGTFVWIRETSSTAPDLWVANSKLSNPKRLTRINPALDKYTFGVSQLVQWRSLDGNTLHGALLLPAGYQAGSRYPLIVWVYGGSLLSNTLNHFGLGGWAYELQMLSTRGYAILAPDAPLTGGTPMLSTAKAILPGVNKLIDLGIADSTRVGVIGHSFGGYSALSLLVQTNRFAAAVVIAGTASLLTEYGALNADGYSFGVGWAESGQGLMQASPWERRERYIENSPYFYLDRLKTPTLLISGTADEVVPPYSSDELYTALRRLGKTVVYARYMGVGHQLSQMNSAQLKDFYGRVTNWFDSYLHGDRKPASDKHQ